MEAFVRSDRFHALALHTQNRIPASKVQKCKTAEVRDIPRVTCSSMYYTATRIRGMQKSLACIPQGELPSSSTRRIPAIWFGRTIIVLNLNAKTRCKECRTAWSTSHACLSLSLSRALSLRHSLFSRTRPVHA